MINIVYAIIAVVVAVGAGYWYGYRCGCDDTELNIISRAEARHQAKEGKK